jgi:hypothetical protein
MLKSFSLLIALSLFSGSFVKAQSNFDDPAMLTFGIGVASGFPLTHGFRDWHSPAVGLTGHAEVYLKDKLYFLAEGTGQRFFAIDSDKDPAYRTGDLTQFILQGGLRYYALQTDEQGSYVYIEPKAGVAMSKFGTRFNAPGTKWDPNLSYAFALGYLVNEHYDLQVKYQGVATKPEKFSYIGVALTYNFSF